MTALDDELSAIKAAQADTTTKIAAVKTDVETLLAKIAAFPPSGLTADQQTALDAIKANATGINNSLSAVDTEANPPVPGS